VSERGRPEHALDERDAPSVRDRAEHVLDERDVPSVRDRANHQRDRPSERDRTREPRASVVAERDASAPGQPPPTPVARTPGRRASDQATAAAEHGASTDAALDSERERSKRTPAGTGEHDPSDASPDAAVSRYSISVDDPERFIVCRSAPNLHLFVERGLAVSKGARKRYPRQTIFLDGAFVDAPFLDNQQRQYSLDHHAGCLRSFTLATCEQAVVMLLQGLPLDEGEWQILINEPDLDAVLAAWVLFNHAELLADEQKLLHAVMPLVRVEGVIDAHGLDMSVLTGLPAERYQAERERIDVLRAPEAEHRSRGDWDQVDYCAYTADLLRRIDKMLVPAEYWLGRVQVVETLELPIDERKLVVLCHAQSGIYEAEAQLKERFGKQLGVIVLDQGGRRFTLRQVDPFLPKTLNSAFALLNEHDPRVKQVAADQEDDGWGGSDEIGGSPRRSGSGLDGRQVLELTRQAYANRRSWWRRLFRRKSSS
jgi:hypothetical protein